MKNQQSKISSIEEITASVRKNKLTVMLNDRELRALERYERTYNVKNRSKFVRDVLFSTILAKFDEDAPTLF